MSIWNPLRKLYIKTTNITNGYHDDDDRLVSFYKLWSKMYDFSIKLDPAYYRQLTNMIKQVVSPSDHVLDIGCGTGLATIYSAQIAKKVTGVDMSSDMLLRLRKKTKAKKIDNIELIEGKYPDDITLEYDSIISSFALVHFSKEMRPLIYESMYENLKENGRIGLFSAQGEIAHAFETKIEIDENLKNSGFHNIVIQDVSDIYRIVIAEK
ncbi:MAG: class I SAM-dependent methyltransferase [Clostridiales bacterium]|nr:class I SAM-dependent methyltransferase [Clostridiales bacterium]